MRFAQDLHGSAWGRYGSLIEEVYARASMPERPAVAG
jgi:hypothetical protein